MIKENALHKKLEQLSPEEFVDLLESASPEELNRIASLPPPSSHQVGYVSSYSSLTSDRHGTLLSVLDWWEVRRIPYNVIVGLSGLPLTALVAMWAHVPAAPLFVLILAYAVVANV